MSKDIKRSESLSEIRRKIEGVDKQIQDLKDELRSQKNSGLLSALLKILMQVLSGSYLIEAGEEEAKSIFESIEKVWSKLIGGS